MTWEWERKAKKVELPKLTCTFCGAQGLYYLNHDSLHCEAHACCAQCPECQEWFEAIVPTIVDGPRPASLSQTEPTVSQPKSQGEPMPHAPDAPADPQDKKAYCEYGVKKEFEFIDFFDTHVEKGGVEINVDKVTDKYAPDILLYGELADLKAQRTPFFTAARYKLDPRFTVTFNKKDVERYTELYPEIHIVFWIDWKTTEWKPATNQNSNTIKVQEQHGVYLATFEQISRMIHKAPLHEYKDRKNDRQGNAKSSYLLDVRAFTQLYPPQEQELYASNQ
jgi:hypothetical protein